MSKRKLPCQRHAGRQGHIIARNNSTSKIRAREPISRSFGMIRGKFPSQKAGRMIHWESQIERDAVLLFEFSPGVISFREQPLTIYYVLDTKTRRYTPDFEIVLRTGEIIFVEIKPVEKLQDQNEHRRFLRITEHFNSIGRKFLLLTDQRIRQPILLANLQILQRYRQKLSTLDHQQFVERFNSVQEMKFSDAVRYLGSAAIVWNLIGKQLLHCDLQKPITDQTMLSTIEPENSNEKLYF